MNRCVVGFLLVLLALAASAHAAAADKPRAAPLHVVIAYGPGEKPLKAFGEHLESTGLARVSYITAAKAKSAKVDGKEQFAETAFTGLEALETCDVIVSNLYRTWPSSKELETLRRAFRSKPVVGLRKAHHGFQNWLDIDSEVFGVNYKGHYFGKNVMMKIVEKHKDHVLFKGVTPFLPGGGLYSHTDVGSDVEIYMVGGPEDKEPMPQCWSRVVKDRGNQRVFYTRYDPDDLKDAGVRDMLTRAIVWAAGRDPQLSIGR